MISKLYTSMKLNDEQKYVIKEVLRSWRHKPVQVITGPAGSGKTTIIRHLIRKLNNWAVCSFTGKAASVLRKKGVSATTIHSLIYRPTEAKDQYNNPIFSKVENIPYDGIIIDEGSMLSENLYKDLLSFNLPILIFGDRYQLEPISSNFNIMRNYDFALETIHRNAGEIAHFAEWVRKGYNPAAFANYYPCQKVKFVQKWEADSYLLGVDQVICAFNKTRVELNSRVRYGKNFTTGVPVIGDRIMCLKNDHLIGLYNGMQGEIAYLYHNENKMHFKAEDRLFEILYDPSQFGREKYNLEDYHRDDPHPFDWCYVITCHKAQGDEWDNVMVFEQRCNQWDHRRWCYTAASRARLGLVWVLPF